jgi:MerR family mercuric resistance operon transcriptional regulator
MAQRKKPDMKIGHLAEEAGVHLETIRYYQRLGIMPTPRREYGTVRRYGNDALGRLHFIKRARALGFSLDEVKRLLELSTTGRCDDARAIAEQKSRIIDAQIADLRAAKAALNELIGACNAGGKDCPMVDRLSR